MPIIDHFGVIAPIYDRLIFPKVDEQLISLLNLSGGEYLLDMGGGTGRVGSVLRQYSREVIVGDLSINMLRQASRKWALQTLQTSVEQLPFPENTWDRIIMVDALHHVHNQRQAIREMVRILKPGGVLLIEEPDILLFGVKWIALLEKVLLMQSHFLKGEEIATLLPEGVEYSLVHKNPNVWIRVLKI